MSVPPVDAPPIDRAAVTPSVDEVALLLRTRTISAGGGDAGTFTDDTWPSQTDVAAIIELAADEVLGQVPANVEQRLWPAIERTIGVRAAMTVEVSFYREAATDLTSLSTTYGTSLTALQGAVGADVAIASGVSVREQDVSDALIGIVPAA